MAGWHDYVREVRPTVFSFQRCDHPTPVLAKIRTVRGHWQVKWWCFRCSRGTSGAVRQEGIDIEALPMARDNGTPERQEQWKEPCARCGELAFCDWHHWAPRHLFGSDADSWPMALLCRPCHMEWHRTVTPNMHRKASRDA